CERVPHDLGGTPQVQLPEDAGSVGADRFHAQVDLFGDFGGALARREQARDLELAVRQTLVRQLVGRPAQVGGQGLADRGADVAPTSHDAPNRGEELFRRALFGEVSGRSGPEHSNGVLLRRMHAEHQDRNVGELPFEVFQELEAAAAGHRDVEHDGVPRLFPRELERFFGAGDLSDRNRGSLLFQDIPQPLPHNRVIVTNEDSHRPVSRHWRRGILTLTRVPSPGALWIATSPPKARARSRIPRSPSDLTLVRAACGMPAPSSRTSSTTLSRVLARTMRAAVARAWRATLVKASWQVRNSAIRRSGPTSNGWRGALSVPAIPVRFSTSSACHSRAATRPRSSRIAGRSSLDMRRTSWSVSSTTVPSAVAFSDTPPGRPRSCW